MVEDKKSPEFLKNSLLQSLKFLKVGGLFEKGIN